MFFLENNFNRMPPHTHRVNRDDTISVISMEDGRLVGERQIFKIKVNTMEAVTFTFHSRRYGGRSTMLKVVITRLCLSQRDTYVLRTYFIYFSFAPINKVLI